MVAAVVGVVVVLAVAFASRRAARRPAADAHVRRWLLRGATLIGAALVVAGLVDVLVPGEQAAGIGLSAGTVLGCTAVYQGLVRWNRRRTLVSDPGDWLNGAGAVLGALALGYLVVDLTPASAGLPVGALVAVLARAAALTVLLGTSATVLAIADLRTDGRAVVLATGTAAALAASVAETVALVHDPVGAPGWQVVAATAGYALLLAAVAAWPSRAGAGLDSSPQATTWGSVVVIVAGAVIMLVDFGAGRTSGVAACLAVAAVLVASVRVARLVRDLEGLVASRAEARTDTLTGVANRRALVEAVDQVSARPQGAALLVIDLDRFKDVNDQHGHVVGDRVVREVAERLHRLTDGLGLLARLGGDEFAVVLHDPDPGRAVDLARRACRALEDPIQVDGRVLRVSASVGVASTALSDHRDGELLRCADAAMFAAKRGGSGVSVYDQDADSAARDRLALSDDARALLGRGEGGVGELVLHYQPQLDAGSGAVLGVEALVRWDHPGRGLLAPDAFLGLVEDDGLMSALTWHVLDAATRQAAAWRERGLPLAVAVNLSASCLESPGLVDVLRDALRRSDLPAGALVVEVTETTLMRDPALAVDVARQIQDLGVDVSIDDFGTGYSSLTYLQDLPARELKLDRAFTRTLAHEPRTRAIVSGTVELAHRLGLRVVAEGVEDDLTLRLLRDLGCDRTQGYLHTRPLPLADLESWLAASGAPLPGPVVSGAAPRS